MSRLGSPAFAATLHREDATSAMPRRTLSVTQVSVLPDPERRAPEALLEAWRTLPDVALAVARQGARVSVVQAAAESRELERGPVRFRFVRTRAASRLERRLGLWATPLSRPLIEAVRETRPDVIHFHGLCFPRHAGALIAALPGAPLLVQDHADGVPRRWRRSLHRRGLRGVAAVAFTAPEQAEPFLTARLLSPGLPVLVVPESSSHFTPGDPQAARAETGIGGDPCLLWLGNLDANKDPHTVLDAVALLATELPDLSLWCCFRHAPLLVEVATRVERDPALKGRVHLLGIQPRERVERLLRAADFLVQGSHREGSGYAVIEALACGTPPVVTDIPAFRALTGNGAVGAHFPPGDARALAGALLASCRKDRAALRREARRHFEGHLSFEALGRSLLDAYRALEREWT